MLEIVKRPRAKEDLKGIWRYSFEKWGEVQADKYLADIDAGIAQLKNNPKLGKPRENLRPGYRSLRVNQHNDPCGRHIHPDQFPARGAPTDRRTIA